VVMGNHAVAIHKHPEEKFLKPHAYSFSISLYPNDPFRQCIRKATGETFQPRGCCRCDRCGREDDGELGKVLGFPPQYRQIKRLCEAMDISFE